MPTCFSYLPFRLQYFRLPDTEIFRASLPRDAQVSRWESGTLWHGGPDPVGHTLVLLCPSSYEVCSEDIEQPKANSLARWHMLLLHPTLLSHQPQGNQQSQESRWRGAKDRRSEKSVLYAEPALPGCEEEEAEEYSQNELSWLHGLRWRETDAGLEVDGAELPGESKAG